MNRSRHAIAAAVLLTLIAVVRVVRTYGVTAQGFDEPCHVSSALELLDKGMYTLDPYNTPLARIAIGLPLLVAGERYPSLTPDDPNRQNYNYVGNQILYEDGHYMRNLELARFGVLPFLVLSVVVVFLWARREFGDFAALMSVALFTTLPVILAFSSIAYTDMAAAFAQSAALFAFATWVDKPSNKSCLWMGFTVGLALLAKFTTIIYLPAAAAFMVACRWRMRSRERTTQSGTTTYTLPASCCRISPGNRSYLGRLRVFHRPPSGEHAIVTPGDAILPALSRPVQTHGSPDCPLESAPARSRTISRHG